jgi:hypothetical protein
MRKIGQERPKLEKMFYRTYLSGLHYESFTIINYYRKDDHKLYFNILTIVIYYPSYDYGS